jgi:hypothetical protein
MPLVKRARHFLLSVVNCRQLLLVPRSFIRGTEPYLGCKVAIGLIGGS